MDQLGCQTWFNLGQTLKDPFQFLTAPQTNRKTPAPQEPDHLQTLWQLLQSTPGFEPSKLLPLLSQLLTNPTSQQMRQQIAEGLLQRAPARLICQWALDWEVSDSANSALAFKQH